MPKKSNLKNADPNEVAKHLGLKQSKMTSKKRLKDKVKKDLKAAEETEKLLSSTGEKTLEPGTSNR